MGSCRACGRENRVGRKFCAGCGASLIAGCPSCGAANEPDERFCGECGTDLAATAIAAAAPAPAAPPAWQPASTPVAERRLVTVLFADLVGFTPFAAERDAEDVRTMLTRYFDLASEIITRYGGVVEKFIGDAVMAVWGAPTAREDDAERAVRAGLDLVDAVRTLGPTIQARAGLLTGEAAVTIGAVNQGMVAGDIVNTAARLQSVANPGTVLAGESTMRASSGAIAYEPAGAQELKGKTSPVPAYRALRVVAEVGGRNRAHGLEAPFVGRDDEMRQLKDLFHATARDGRVRLVSVVGPAGIGKSRLSWEFLKYIDGLVDTVWWHEGRAPAYGNGLAFWALGEMVRGRCGLLEGADERTIRAAVAATLAEHVQDPAERAWIEPALLALLGIGDRAASPDQLFAAWRTFFERLAQTAPVVLAFEDLHWADPGTLDFIDHLLDWTRDLPILILTLARPELIDRRPAWGAGRRYFSSLFLEPLPEPAMRALLAGLVPGLPERAVRSIVGRADGMPLYAVETVRTLLADGRLVERDGRYEPVGDLSELAVPETLTALIAARLDALDPADRSLLHDAAVLGQSFTPASLAALVDATETELEPRLRTLVRREILALQADPRSPERGQYAFVQALIREVAYNTLSKRDRKAKHLAAARWFESVGTDELAGALARHYLAAWQNSTEGPEADALAGQARLALRAAADRALALHAIEQAVDLWREALAVAVEPVERVELLSLIAESLSMMARLAESEATARAARDLAIAIGDLVGEARAMRWLHASLMTQGRRVDSRPLLLETIERTRPALPHPAVLPLHRQLAGILRAEGDLDGAFAKLEEVLVMAERAGHRATVLETMSSKGSNFCEFGRMIEGLGLIETAIRGCEALGLDSLVVSARANLIAFTLDIDPRAALDAARSLIDLARRTGDRVQLNLNILNGSELAIRTGEWDWAVRNLDEVLAADLDPADRLAPLEQRTIIATLRGEDVTDRLVEAVAIAGDSPDLVALLDDRFAVHEWVEGRYAEAAQRWRQYAVFSPLNATMALAKAARVCLWAGDVTAARGDLEAHLATAKQGAGMDAARATMRAGIAALDGDRAGALRGYRAALQQWRDLGLPWDEALCGLDMALLLGPGEPEVAAAADAAREVFARLGARPFLQRLDAAVGTAPEAGSAPAAVADPGPASTVTAPG